MTYQAQVLIAACIGAASISVPVALTFAFFLIKERFAA